MSSKVIKQRIGTLANPTKAKIHARFFKTGPGQYGEGDKFLGLTVPQQRKIAKQFAEKTPLDEVAKLLQSGIHEHRLTSLLIMVSQFEKGDAEQRLTIYEAYLQSTRYVNNWDLVDLSAPKIVGEYLLDKPRQRKILYQLAKSNYLWERRIAMLATFTFIKQQQFTDSLKIAAILLTDSHDLIHKAGGWMLREIGKIDQVAEEKFLKKHYKIMPRTMLRYAIERFDPEKRAFYMKK